MRCDDASRALYAGGSSAGGSSAGGSSAGGSSAGESSAELEIHLSACDECRLLSQDLAGLNRAFARARGEWAPSPAFRVVLPSVNWRRLAAAACLLLFPLAGAAGMSLRAPAPAAPARDLGAILEPAAPAQPNDRQILATLFLQEESP